MRMSVAGIFGSTVTLLGAFLVGVVIHRSLVLGEFSILAPAGVLGLVAGLALVAIGRRLEARFEPADYVPGSEDEEGEGEGEKEESEGSEFDERFSPVPQDRLERREATTDGEPAADADAAVGSRGTADEGNGSGEAVPDDTGGVDGEGDGNRGGEPDGGR